MVIHAATLKRPAMNVNTRKGPTVHEYSSREGLRRTACSLERSQDAKFRSLVSIRDTLQLPRASPRRHRIERSNEDIRSWASCCNSVEEILEV